MLSLEHPRKCPVIPPKYTVKKNIFTYIYIYMYFFWSTGFDSEVQGLAPRQTCRLRGSMIIAKEHICIYIFYFVLLIFHIYIYVENPLFPCSRGEGGRGGEGREGGGEGGGWRVRSR